MDRSQDKHQLDLEYGLVHYTDKPSPRFVFLNQKLGKPIVMMAANARDLLHHLDKAESAYVLVEEKCLSNSPPPDEVFFTATVANYGRSNQIRIECNIYEGKCFMFLKKFFKLAQKPSSPEAANSSFSDSKAGDWISAKGCLRLDSHIDLNRIKEFVKYWQ